MPEICQPLSPDTVHTPFVSYAITQPARAATGEYYDVCASPRGDLLVWFAESGPQSWESMNLGVFGILSFFINLVVFRRKWRVIIRTATGGRFASPTSGVIYRQTVSKLDAQDTVTETARTIEASGVASFASQ
jgi:hypothetical protein